MNKKSLKVPQSLYIYVAVIFIIVGILMSIIGVIELQQSLSSESWNRVNGHVLTSEVNEVYSDNNKRYGAIVEYSYMWKEKVYRSDKIGFINVTGSEDVTYDLASRYPVNSVVDVYVNPKKPSTAVLLPGAGMISYLIPIIGQLTFWAGVLYLLYVYRSKNSSRSK